jgi:elongation factor Ts
MSSIEAIKQLRDETGASPVEIKKALEKADGNLEKAKDILRVLAKTTAGKKVSREAMQGIIDYYLHPNAKTGVLIDIRCESDFVAKSPDFKNLAHEICLQIAAMSPLYVSEDKIPAEMIDREINIYKEQVKELRKPENITRQIVDGKIKKYQESISLLSQPWVKDGSKTIKDLIDDVISKVGEKIEIRSFARYEI